MAESAFRAFYLHPKAIAKTVGRVWLKLPPKRAARFILAGLDYFVISKLKPSPHKFGTRY